MSEKSTRRYLSDGKLSNTRHGDSFSGYTVAKGCTDTNVDAGSIRWDVCYRQGSWKTKKLTPPASIESVR